MSNTHLRSHPDPINRTRLIRTSTPSGLQTTFNPQVSLSKVSSRTGIQASGAVENLIGDIQTDWKDSSPMLTPRTRDSNRAIRLADLLEH